MSNIFKANSRFAILSEDKKDDVKNEKKNEKKKGELKNEKKNGELKNEKKNENLKQVNEPPKINSFKDDRPMYNDRPTPSSNLFSKKLSDKAEQQRKEDELKRRDAELEKSLSIDNFPELSKNTNTNTNTNTITNLIETPNFLEKIKKEKKIVQKVKKKEEIPYGWTLITYNKKTNKSYIEYNEQYIEDEQNKKEEEEKMKSFMIIDALVNLHLKRKEKYINEWGYDEYEKMFISPNYDPEYFDKLDAKYEEEMEKLREQEYAQEETDSE
jgi:hypothetical protein